MTRGAPSRIALLGGLFVTFVAVAAAAQPTHSTTSLITYIRSATSSAPAVWIAAANGGNPHKLAAGDGALLAPSGAEVAVGNVVSSKGTALELYAPSGRLIRGYFTAAKVAATPLAWSSNSRYLAVALASTSVSGAGSGLALIDTSTMRARTVARGYIYGASFNPAGGVVVFGKASSQRGNAPVDLYVANSYGGPANQLTTNGHSLAPLWVKKGIVFDRETSRGQSKAPVYQLWLMSGSTASQLTHLKVPALLDGLVPVAASSDGNRILASYDGEDTENAWTVQLSPLRVSEVKVDGKSVQAGAISQNGRQLLIDVGGFERPGDDGAVESLSFTGGRPVKLGRGAEPSWNQ